MKTNAVSAAALLVVLAQAVSAQDEKPCAVTSCHNSYDLSPLSSEKDYVFESYNGRNVTLNVCRSVVQELWNSDVDNPQDVGAFTRGDHGDISLGETNTTLHVRGGDPVLLLTNGSPCPNSQGMKASTVIRFICDKHEGEPHLVAQLPPEDDSACAYFIEWRTKHACPLPSRYKYWKTTFTLIVIFVALIFTAVALRMLHKLIKRRRNSEGLLPLEDSGPWYAVLYPSSIADRARDLRRHLTGQDPWGHPNGREPSSSANGSSRLGGWGWRPKFGRGGRRNNNFTRLPQSSEEEAMMGGNGPFSVHDEDDDEEDGHQTNGHATMNGGHFAEESAAWGAARPRGMDSAGVIRL